jgi:hypothetical protein
MRAAVGLAILIIGPSATSIQAMDNNNRYLVMANFSCGQYLEAHKTKKRPASQP